MYKDILFRFIALAESMVARYGPNALPPIDELRDKQNEVEAMVHFAKHHYRQKHICEFTCPDKHDNCALHCAAHQLGACPHCTCDGICNDKCHPAVCAECSKYRRWGVNVQLFLFRWKTAFDRCMESTGLPQKRSGILNDEIEQYHDFFVPLYEPPLLIAEAKTLTTSSCQVAKQYSYVTKYFSSHTIRGMWQSKAEKKMIAGLMGNDNGSLGKFVLRTDHKSKKNPSKSETEQGYDMGLRGMSTHGFQLVFATEQNGERHLVTVHYDIFYEQSSEQTLPEAMSALRLVMNQIGDSIRPSMSYIYVLSCYLHN